MNSSLLHSYLKQAVTPWHGVRLITERLNSLGYRSDSPHRLGNTNNVSTLKRGYWVCPEGDALIAWHLPATHSSQTYDNSSLTPPIVWASHLDSPTLKLKPRGETSFMSEKGSLQGSLLDKSPGQKFSHELQAHIPGKEPLEFVDPTESMDTSDSATTLATDASLSACTTHPLAAESCPKLWTWDFEPYGAPITATWAGHPLFLAGRLLLRERSTGKLRQELVSWSDRLCVIEPLAIHFDRNVNSEGLKLNPQEHLKALVRIDARGGCAGGRSLDASHSSLHRSETPPLQYCIDETLGEGYELLAHDLFATPSDPLYTLFGSPRATNEISDEETSSLICSARIDNIASAAAMAEAMPSASAMPETGVVALWLNHEEIGSRTLSGAQSNLWVEMLHALLGRDITHQALVISIDGAHGHHPAWPQMSDPSHAPSLGGGPCVKHNSQGRYCRDFRALKHLYASASHAKVPLQVFAMRSDLPCGSTIGPLLSTALGSSCVDIGLPQLGMHAMREVMDCSDYRSLVHLLQATLSFISII